jgi:beta-phosphoglucomutase
VEIETILQKAGLQGYFETIVSAEQVEKNKPAPDGFLLALERLNENHTPAIEPGECIVVEDSHWGLEAANAAKMKSVAVTNSYSADILKPYDAVVDNLSELTIEQLNKICN